MKDFDLIISRISSAFGELRQPGLETVSDASTPRAAVALVVRNNNGIAEVLIIQRADNPADHWSGHLALPGGRASSEDCDLIDTAIREVYEEVGLALDRDRSIIGQLEDISPQSPRLPPIVITPFVAVAPSDAKITFSHEVAHAFWISIDLLKREGPMANYSVTIEGADQSWPAFHSEKGPIWGITQRIISVFLSALD
jgi:8-oxo-dGTP pyrophosphatase MutT (NUDIX family)